MVSSSGTLVVITGASSGIGAACAKHFHAKGHSLLLLSRRLDRMESLASELDSTYPAASSRVLCKTCDVTDLPAVEEAVKQAEACFGPTSCIVNNAGLMQLGSAHEQNPEEWVNMMQINVLGVMNGIRAVIRGMMDRRSGTVINISSIAGKKTFGNHGVYCATKFGVHALTETFREEYAKYNVKFVVVAPGVVETELLGHTTSDAIVDGYKQWKTTIEALQPEDVANACYFAFDQPPRCCIREIALAPTLQEP
eukprot:ANDGO_00542.mRNA.1 putative oxidoreductase SSP1627